MSIPIVAKNLSFDYGGGPVFENASFSVDKGDFVALIGANGAGKSTLLKLVLGELSPGFGQVSLFGTESARFKDWSKIGYVPQSGFVSGASFPASVLEIVTANLYGKIGLFHPTGTKHKAAAREALSLVGMEKYEKALIGELSVGQLKRVMLARALVSKPSLIILDEPTAGLDSESTESLYDLLPGLVCQGSSVLMVTHDTAAAASLATKVLCLEEKTLLELSVKHSHPHGQDCRREGGNTHGHI